MFVVQHLAHGRDRRGLELLWRYCARAVFAQERLTWAGEDRGRLVYRLSKPMPDGASHPVDLTPPELLDRQDLLIPPPRRHRHRYHEVFAPNAPLWA